MDTAAERPRSDAGVVIVLGLALTVFLGLTAWWVFSEIGHARAQRESLLANFATRQHIGRAFSDLQDAETAQRGFVITGNPTFLEPYGTAVADLPSHYTALRFGFAEEPDQRERLARMETLARAKLEELEAVIELRRQGRAAEAMARVASGRGNALMSEIRTITNEMREVERRRIDESIAEDARRAEQTERIILLLFVGMLIGAGATVVLVRRYALARHTLLMTIRAEAARERAIFEAAMDGILVVRPDGQIERANPAAERIFHTARRGLEGQAAAALVEPSAAGDLSRLLQGRGREGAAKRREIAGARADGGTFPLEVSVAELKDADEAVLLFVRDISERREVERMKDEFVSTVSHELRTPLTSIAGSLGLIAGGAAGPLPEKAARLITIAQSNSQRLVRLINDVLDLEKLESGKLPFHFEVLELRELGQRALDGVKGYADQLGVDLVLSGGPTVPIRGDPDRLVQIVTNLLSNAAKYSPKGGTVRVTVTREGSNAQLTVRDSGPGIPEAFRDRIFSRFAQADSSDARGKSGTGLGLYIAREIAERHGGRLWFESPPEGGAVFHLDLPLLEEAAAPAPVRDKVLLVEDEPAAAALLTAIMEHEGLQVDTAGTLAEARSLLEDPSRYGAMVLDLRLPDGDGMDLVREIRQRPDVRGVPVVVVSAEASRGRDPAVRPLEVVDWMEKPVDPDRLAELVRAAVGPPRREGTIILHLDDDRDIRELVATALSGIGQVISVDGLAQARQVLADRRPDLVILDLELRDGQGMDLLEDLQDEPGNPIPVVVFSAQDASGELAGQVALVLVKSRTSLMGLVSAVRKLVEPAEEPAG
jgi:PAS domain S-box-containing protein